jgi:hypothetical protein
MNTAVRASHEQGLLKATQKVSSTYLKTFFTNWEEVFGKSQNIKVLLQSENEPHVEVSSRKSIITADTRIRILNPFTDEYDAVTLKCKMSTTIEFELLEDFKLAGEISDMRVSVSDIKVFFMSEVTTESMNLQVEALAKPFVSLINTQLM